MTIELRGYILMMIFLIAHQRQGHEVRAGREDHCAQICI
jgi:hypothetical protein